MHNSFSVKEPFEPTPFRSITAYLFPNDPTMFRRFLNPHGNQTPVHQMSERPPSRGPTTPISTVGPRLTSDNTRQRKRSDSTPIPNKRPSGSGHIIVTKNPDHTKGQDRNTWPDKAPVIHKNASGSQRPPSTTSRSHSRADQLHRSPSNSSLPVTPTLIQKTSSNQPVTPTAPYALTRRNSRSSQPPILFYHKNQPYYGFTNFSNHDVKFEGKVYPTSEHLFQSLKFLPRRPLLAEHIRTCSPLPRMAFSEARRFQPEVRHDWKSYNIKAMELALECKFSQHRSLKKELLNTGDAELIENSDEDAFWGCGSDGMGQNELGKALVRLRTKLRR